MSLNVRRRSRAFCFTANNYTQELLDLILGISCRYVVFGKETAPSTGTPHLQGYIYFDQPKALSTILRLLPGSHVEVARGSSGQNYEYCTKGGNYVERGNRPLDSSDCGRLERDRYIDAWAAAVRGDLLAIPEDIRIRHYSTLKRIGKDYQSGVDRIESTCGIWIWGESGSGKTSSVYDRYPDAYPKPLSKWWDGYQGEETVLLDDIDPESRSWLGRFVKIWGDKYPFIAEEKGGSRKIRPLRFIITSQYSIEQVFVDDETRSAVRRRYVVIEKIKDQNIIL